MNILKARDLSGETRRRWAEERRKLLRGILKNPGSSEAAKKQAREKISESRQPGDLGGDGK